MDNGRGQRKLSAKELTEEIERETNANIVEMSRNQAQQLGKMAAGAEHLTVVNNTETDYNRGQAQRVGWQVIEGGKSAPQGIFSSGEAGTAAEAAAEREILRDEAELEYPERFVGQESALQEQERLADDQEDMQSEEGKGLKFVDKIVTANQEAVAQAIVPEVNKIVNRKSYRPEELAQLYRQGVNKTLAVFNRKIGDRN